MWESICRIPRLGLRVLRNPSLSLRHHSSVAQLYAPRFGCANEQSHVNSVNERLEETGFLIIKLGFGDDESHYMKQLILNLHKYHGHGLPITHSASRGWFWDVRPLPGAQQTAAKPARSETAQDFPWHTDCSYEQFPPRFFALQVLQPDRCGGGTLSILNVDRLTRLLSPSARLSLSKPEFRINVPAEFIKSDERHITTGLLGADVTNGAMELRFREEILTPLTDVAKSAVEELGRILLSEQTKAATIELTPELLPRGSIVLINNRRWLHARSEVKDPDRHLRRVRWDTRPLVAEGSLGMI
ncbi:hypothetical protein PRK78_006814 [Emydomyces testavorans]|uniref:TauD/TfdA-like domain-containing protein n=1 Tax=Emydomyces testavorans TaxID=2070801 RepID=A0AAF0DN38_9EURO|nr:hypothetical protein PRK78_006814 [Emydomyces testavorans]